MERAEQATRQHDGPVRLSLLLTPACRRRHASAAADAHRVWLYPLSSPPLHAAWRLASELGASIKGSIGPDVTHVVAGRDAHGIVASNTDKVRWALSHATHAVTIDWLTTCGHLWRKAAEHENEVEPTDPARATSRRREKGKNADSSAAPPPAGVN